MSAIAVLLTASAMFPLFNKMRVKEIEMMMPGPASPIGRAFAFKSSDPSLIQQVGGLLRLWQLNMCNLNFSEKISDE